MSKLICTAIPILPGKQEQWRNFVNELQGSRKAEFKQSREKLNIRERTFYQQTPMGDFVIVTLEGDDPETAFKNFGSEQNEFTKWFIEQVKDVHGFDLTQPPPGPMPELIVDSSN